MVKTYSLLTLESEDAGNQLTSVKKMIKLQLTKFVHRQTSF